MEPIKSAAEAVTLVTSVIKVAAENPDARAAGAELGKAALTVAKAINNALLPLAAINFACAKAREYFQNDFESDLSAKVSDIPAEHLIEPKASVAGPALQNLAFAHEEPDLKDFYLNLLATTMDDRIVSLAHPSFVEIIKQLDAREARLLRHILNINGSAPIVELQLAVDSAKGFHVLERHLINFADRSTGQPLEVSDIAVLVENWIRLGLVTVDYGLVMSANNYSWESSRPEVERHKERHIDGQLTFRHGIIRPTAFGKTFAQAVGILITLPMPADSPPVDRTADIVLGRVKRPSES